VKHFVYSLVRLTLLGDVINIFFFSECLIACEHGFLMSAPAATCRLCQSRIWLILLTLMRLRRLQFYFRQRLRMSVGFISSCTLATIWKWIKGFYELLQRRATRTVLICSLSSRWKALVKLISLDFYLIFHTMLRNNMVKLYNGISVELSTN